MRILINAAGAKIGGAVRHLSPFLRALSENEPTWAQFVYLSPGKMSEVEALPLATLREMRLPGTAGRLYWDAVGLCSEARTQHVDCIVNLTNYGPLSKCKPNILYQRNSIYFDPEWVRTLTPIRRVDAAARRFLAFREIATCDAVVTPSDAMAGYLRAWPGAPATFRQRTIPHAIDTEQFAFAPRPLQTLDPVSLVVVSNPGIHKGVDTAIRLTAELLRRRHDPTLTLTFPRTYSGPHARYVEMCVALADELQVANRVKFVGAVADVESLYHKADVLLVPSLTESFGFPLLEAMACGTPILATAIPSSLELASSFANWFPPGDHVTAADRLAEMTSRPIESGLQSLHEGRRRAEELNWTSNAKALASLVRDCVGGARGDG